MENFAQNLILKDKVYALTIEPSKSQRAFERRLIDYHVDLTNPLAGSDRLDTPLGMQAYLRETYREKIPIEWVLLRFLAEYIKSDNLDALGGPTGLVLDRTNYERYLGPKSISNTDADNQLWIILDSWIRTFPKKEILWLDIYVSTVLSQSTLDRSIKSFIHTERMREIGERIYEISPKFLDDRIKMSSPPK